MKEIIILGRSPFINSIDVNKIDYDKYDVCCINSVVPGTKPKYLVSVDFDLYPEVPEGCEWVSRCNDWVIERTNAFITEEGRISWGYYSSSAAVNLALLRGYRTIYLAGIDLIEDGKPFQHYFGKTNEEDANVKYLKYEKDYIKTLCQCHDAKIYNLNPDCDWLPTKDIGILQEKD